MKNIYKNMAKYFSIAVFVVLASVSFVYADEYGFDDYSYGSDNYSYGFDDSSYGSDNYSYGFDDYSYGSDDYSYGSDNYSYGFDDYSYGSDDYSYGYDEYSYGSDDYSYGFDDYSYGFDDYSYGFDDEYSYGFDDYSYGFDDDYTYGYDSYGYNGGGYYSGCGSHCGSSFGGGYYFSGGYGYNGGGGCGSHCGGGGGGGNPDRDLVIHCAANNDEIPVGESVTWIAQATGGNGNYTYTWTGSDGLLGQQRTVTKSYEQKGVKSATLTVKSGNKQKTVACTDVFVFEERVTEPNNLSVSCSASDTDVETDERVTWTAHVSGGNGNYSYDWDGSEGLSGSGRTVSISYDNDGDKSASVRVTSGNQSKDVRCDDEVNVEDEDDNDDEDDRDIRVSCEADITSTSNGTRVRWTANVSRENGSVDYDWSGTDGLSSDDDSVTKTYYTSGMKYAQVEVEDSDDDTDEAECSVFVGAVLGYTSTYVPPYIPPATQGTGIYLSQVPYTGIEDISLSLVLFLGSLALASAVGAYKIVKAKAKRDGAISEVSESQIETLARGSELILSRDALTYIATVVRKEHRDAKEVIAYMRSKIAKVDDSLSAVSLEKAKQLIA